APQTETVRVAGPAPGTTDVVADTLSPDASVTSEQSRPPQSKLPTATMGDIAESAMPVTLAGPWLVTVNDTLVGCPAATGPGGAGAAMPRSAATPARYAAP